MMTNSEELKLLKQTLNDIVKPYKGKSKQRVVETGSTFKREFLIETVFELKDVAEGLLCIVDDLLGNNNVTMFNQINDKLDKIINDSLPAIPEAVVSTLKPVAVPEMTQKTDMKHAIFIENEDEERFSERKWNEVVQYKINDKLKNIPVAKAAINKSGQGYLLLPDEEAQKKAEIALQDDFKLTVSSRKQKKLLPKMKIYDVATYDREDKALLKQAILEKNYVINELVRMGKTLDIVFIDVKKETAVIRVSPEIRHELLKYGTIFLGMQCHNVKDNLHVIQCFSCQQYGHKQGSEHCKNGNGVNVCLYCAGEHRSKDCNVKYDSSHHKCFNCFKSKNPFYRDAASGHTTTSYNCPIVKKELYALASRTEGIDAKKFL